jgi:hypothetical protein
VRTLVVSALVFAGIVAAAAQPAPRTPWGDPDLQGVWPSGQMNAIANMLRAFRASGN